MACSKERTVRFLNRFTDRLQLIRVERGVRGENSRPFKGKGLGFNGLKTYGASHLSPPYTVYNPDLSRGFPTPLAPTLLVDLDRLVMLG